MKEIKGFEGEYRYLSNFWPCLVEFEDIVYNCSEGAYQAAKTLDLNLRREFQLLDGSKSKKLGRKIQIREDWDGVKLDVMYTICKNKFLSNSDLKHKLLSTQDAYLEETNWWNDKFWGVCKGVGENHLGKILMKIRQELLETSKI